MEPGIPEGLDEAVNPVVFSRGQIVDLSTILKAKRFDCLQVVGGEEKARSIVISQHSIFCFEPASSKGTEQDPTDNTASLLFQRSLLEIGSVKYVNNLSFTVIFKHQYGGNRAEFKYPSPLKIVNAVRTSLNQLGVNGKETAGKSLSKKAGSSKHERRISGGGSFREHPLDAIRRLEEEMDARPTLTLVRAIMDRYRRIIDSCVSDPDPLGQKRAEELMQNLQKFLQRRDVTKCLSDESKIMKQRERQPAVSPLVARNNRKSIDGLDVDGPAVASTKNQRTGDVASDDTLSKDINEEEEEELDLDNCDRGPGSGYVGTPYRRRPGEVYYSTYRESQIDHARVAEQGVLLRHRVYLTASVSPPPKVGKTKSEMVEIDAAEKAAADVARADPSNAVIEIEDYDSDEEDCDNDDEVSDSSSDKGEAVLSHNMADFPISESHVRAAAHEADKSQTQLNHDNENTEMDAKSKEKLITGIPENDVASNGMTSLVRNNDTAVSKVETSSNESAEMVVKQVVDGIVNAINETIPENQ